MDGRTLGGKTVTFLVICVFMAVFLLLFGTRYVLLGITVSSAAMLMLQKDSIRDVIAFPKVQNASELMTQCPAEVDEQALKELSLKLDIQKEE